MDMGWLIHIYILNFFILFYLSIYLFLFVHNHPERTDRPIDIKFGMSTWGGGRMVIT